MKFPVLMKTVAIALASVSITAALAQMGQADEGLATTGVAYYICEKAQGGKHPGMWTTYAITKDNPNKPIPVIRWYSSFFSKAGYTPQRRCEEVTGRFNSLQKDRGGSGITQISTGYLNGLPVVFSPSEAGERASGDNLLFTLKKGENAAKAVQKLFDLTYASASGDALFESSADDGSITVNLVELLNNTPSETVASPDSSR